MEPSCYSVLLLWPLRDGSYNVGSAEVKVVADDIAGAVEEARRVLGQPRGFPYRVWKQVV